MFVPFHSLARDKYGNFWYNPNCDIYALKTRWGDDWEIIGRSNDEVVLNYNLNIANPSQHDLDIVWGNVEVWSDFWLHQYSRAIRAYPSITHKSKVRSA